jgi:uncharacterized protein YhaN
MRIERIELDGFGRFANAQWSLSEGMTILLGANEAGKTTLLNAIRALLFGFESTRDGRTWYPALAGGRRGGRLVLLTQAGERWTVDRHGDRGGVGALVVEAPNGNRGGQDELNRLLGGADRDLFNNIFAFGLGELEAFSSLSSEGVRSRIYGAGSGLGGTSVVDLERRLRNEQELLYKPRGHEQTLTRLLARAEELRGRIAELEQQPAAYEAARSELAELQLGHEELRARRREAAELREHLRRVIEAQPAAARLTMLQRELGEPDSRLDALPPDAEQELGRLITSRDAARSALATLDGSLAAAERRRAELTVDTQLLAELAEIEALRDERLAHEARSAEREAATAAAARLEGELRDQLRRIGTSNEAEALAIDDSIASVEAVRAYESRLHGASTTAERLAERLGSARRDVASAEAQLPATTDGDDVIAARRRALSELNELRLRAALLAEQGTARSSTGPAMQRWATPVAVGLLLLTFGTLVGGAFDVQPWGSIVGALLGGLATAVLGRGAAGPASPGGLPDLAGRRRELLSVAGLPPDADDAAIARAADDLAAAQASARAAAAQRAQVVERRAALDRLEAEVHAAAAARDGALAEWSAWLADHRLGADLAPDTARQVLEAVGRARRLSHERDEQRQRIATTRDAAATYDQRLEALLGRLGRRVPADASLRPSTVVSLAAEAQQAAATAQRARDLDEALAELSARRAPLSEAADAADRALAAYLERSSAADAEELRTMASAASARERVRQQIRETTATLITLAGSEAAMPALLDEASGNDPATLEARREEAAAEVERLEAEESAASTREGELKGEITRLETADELGAARQELAMLEAQAAQESRRWAVHALALALLAETRRRYERERQPQVVHDAQRYFASITDGRYSRIVAPPGEASVRVEAESGAPRTTDELSRGTAEQLYLALRFGLIEQFGRSAEPLPVVMDDILVNFDRQRAARAARTIRDLARRHQVVFFTCHPQTAELLDPDGVATIQLD